MIDLRFWFLVFRIRISDTGFRIPDTGLRTTMFQSASGRGSACMRAPLQQMVARLAAAADGGATLVVVRNVGCAYFGCAQLKINIDIINTYLYIYTYIYTYILIYEINKLQYNMYIKYKI